MPKRAKRQAPEDWLDVVRRHLIGETWGDAYVLRPIPIPRDLVPQESLCPLEVARGGYAFLWDCGPLPWPDPVRAAVNILYGGFAKEMGTGPYVGVEPDVPTYLIVTPDEETVWAYGLMGFEEFGKDAVPFGEGYCLRYAWIHPLFRRKGLMRAAMQAAADDLGLFVCDRPISRGMREVLRTIGHPQADDMTGFGAGEGPYR